MTTSRMVSVVPISNSEKKFIGTGFVLWREGDHVLIVTAAHVIRDTDNKPCVRKQPPAAQCIGEPNGRDLAILRFTGQDNNLHPLRAGCAVDGAEVVVRGFFAVNQIVSHKVAARLSTGSDRLDNDYQEMRTWTLTALGTERLQKGNSGGPVVDASGCVIGVMINRENDDGAAGVALDIAELEPIWDAEKLGVSWKQVYSPSAPTPTDIPPAITFVPPPEQTPEQSFLLAERAYNLTDWSAASLLYEQYLQARPTDQSAQQRYTEALRQKGLADRYAALVPLRKRDQYQNVLEELQALRREGYTADLQGHQLWVEQRQSFWQRFDLANTACSDQRWADAITLLKSLLFDYPRAAQVEQLLRQAEGALARITRKEITSAIQTGHLAPALDAAEARLRHHPADYEALSELAALIEQPSVSFELRQRAAALIAHNDIRPGVATLRPEWATPISAGVYPLADGVEAQVAKFRVARYPVTIAQYAEFIKAGGYQDTALTNAWWTPEGLRWRAAERPAGPARGKLPALAHLPVSGLSWYEAAAFCCWLTERGHTDGWLNQTMTIRLPSEAEWEIAACWDAASQRMRPWAPKSHEWLNNDVHDPPFDQPTPVGLFPHGASPCGALDMAGNVWEWCASPGDTYPVGAGSVVADFTPDHQRSPVRGGSFKESASRSGWLARRILYTATRADDLGLRVSCIENEG